MGLCGSKTQPMPSQTTTVATEARTKPINRDTVKSKQELRHKEKKDKKKKTQLKSTTVPVVQKKEGSKLTDTSDPSKNKVSPKEAARLAAEKRFQETNEKYNKGELGKKLAQERAKSHKTRLMEEAEKKHAERERENMIYD
ncbi:HN1_G0032300.mRNA.1.CDS.1 [Saccharomyces cerevisiae]|nr:HN1_G0032300.mRNA.1.CDS.1 [Saccharomyces cerevisiae]CAI4444912.1 BAL_1a_G0018760.mRNA.1.CDS.1 [Saccharomyces cerevisiae]CAI7116555.1 BAL_1a_G0018760.mRNA.1.CDS.1 [Saccharomyces cerevisiae]